MIIIDVTIAMVTVVTNTDSNDNSRSEEPILDQMTTGLLALGRA